MIDTIVHALTIKQQEILSEYLEQPVNKLPGIGSVTQQRLNKEQFYTVHYKKYMITQYNKSSLTGEKSDVCVPREEQDRRIRTMA